MYKLRRSRFTKFIAVLLIITLCAAIVGNIVGTYIIMEENLFYASRLQLQQKVYSYVFDYTASDLMRYLKIAEDYYSNDKSYQNYNQSELDLYRSKYGSENTNIYFEITDDYGNIILKNEVRPKPDTFSFSCLYGTTSSYYHDTYFKYGGSEKAEPSVTAQATSPSKYDETDIYGTSATYYENEAEGLSQDVTAVENSQTDNETTTLSNNENTAPEQPLVIDTTEYKSETYEIINKHSGNSTTFIYRYTGEINVMILSFIKEELEMLTYDITDFTATQSDFYVQYLDEDGSSYDIAPVYSAADKSVPLKSFSTVFLTDGKEISLTYSYNGSFSFSEFKSRLQYLSLIARNINNDNLSFSYKQKDGIQLKVTVYVPHYSADIKDIYFYAEKLVDVAIVYKDHIIPITIIDFIGLLVSLVYLFWAAGYVPKKDEPVARGLHFIPFDLYLLLSAAATVFCYGLIEQSDELFMFLGFLGLTFVFFSLIYTLPVRVRTKTLKKNTIIYKFYKFLKSAAAVMDEVTGSRFRIFIIVSVFLFISACETLIFIITDISGYGVSLILMLLRICEAPVIAFMLTSLIALHNGAKKISSGDVSYRINPSLLVGPLKKHANYLNSINGAVNKAVEERMKSESLKTELITNVSHDLKTPLTSIVNYVDLLKKTDITDSKALEYIEVIDRQSQRLKKLTFDIVEASKASTGNIEVHKEPTVLNVILQQTNGEYIERLEEKALTLVTEVPDNSITINTDGRLLWRVIDNLMNNVCKYSMPGTRVYISLWQDDYNAYISFRNISKNKLNISPDELTERFVRGDTSRNTEGSGLGLSIAKSLAEIIGGRLTIIIDGDLFKVTLSLPLKN